MHGRLDRLTRLLRATTGQERVLKEELRRLRVLSARLERELQGVREAARPAGPAGRAVSPVVVTASAYGHHRRFAGVLASRGQSLAERRRETRRQETREQGRLRQVAQARRTLGKLTDRVQAAQDARQLRHEQQAVDEHGR